jgi:type I restriction enzyme, S subunit
MKWPMVKLKDCCTVIGGATPKRDVPEYWSSSDIPWVTPKDVSNLSSPVLDDAPEYISNFGYKSCATYMLPKGSILLTSRAPIGNVAIAGREMCTNQGFKSLVPSEGTDGGYLYHCMRYFSQRLQALGNGATFKEVSKKTVEEFEIPLPPLEEQKRIAAVLDKADAIRRKRQQAIKLADDFLRSVFLDMFGDPVTNPKGWEVCQFEDLTSLVTYGLTVRPQYHEEGVPLISAREIRSGELDFESSPKISRADFDKLSKKGRPQQGDILFSKTGSIGHCAIVRSEVEFALTQNAARIVPNKDVCLPTFLLAFMRTKYFYDLANREAKGNAVKDLQLGTMKNFKMYLPPISLQKKFSDLYQKSAFLSKSEIDSLFLINSKFNSLSQNAFSGEH